MARHSATIHRTPSQELAWVTFEREQTKTLTLHQSFDVAPGSVNGKIDSSCCGSRKSGWIAARKACGGVAITDQHGLDAFGVTDDDRSKYGILSWQGQAQYGGGY